MTTCSYCGYTTSMPCQNDDQAKRCRNSQKKDDERRSTKKERDRTDIKHTSTIRGHDRVSNKT